MKCPECEAQLPAGCAFCVHCGAVLEEECPESVVAGALLAGRFRLIRAVGEGSIGTIWLAEDTRLAGARVACKVLKREVGDDAAVINDLKREVLLARGLRHPNILGIYTFWEVSQTPFITMEYVDKRNLAEALGERGRPFTLTEVTPWVEQLCGALDHAHGRGVLHRDVKPANILLADDGTVRLGDFGIAWTVEEAALQRRGGTTSGTILYMSPEQLRGEAVDERSDIYSLSATIYELLAGRSPFYEGSVVTQIQLQSAPQIEHLSPSVNEVLLAALAKNPAERPDSCRDFGAAFVAAVSTASNAVQDAAGPTVRALSDPAAAETVRLNVVDVEATRRRLGRLLVDGAAITRAQLDEALGAQRESGEPLGTVLVRLGLTDEARIARTLSDQLRLPFVRLSNETVNPDATGLVSAGFARARKCLPIRRDSDRIVIAMVNPLDLAAINAVEAASGLIAEPCIATESDVAAAIAAAYEARSE